MWEWKLGFLLILVGDLNSSIGSVNTENLVFLKFGTSGLFKKQF